MAPRRRPTVLWGSFTSWGPLVAITAKIGGEFRRTFSCENRTRSGERLSGHAGLERSLAGGLEARQLEYSKRDGRRAPNTHFAGALARVKASLLASALRGLDPRRPLPIGWHLSERRASDAAWHNASNVKLRNAHLATVDRSKILDYLLNEAHPDNGGKAQFFISLGFSRDQPELLTKALLEVAQDGELVHRVESVHGEKYLVDGWLSMHTQESRGRSVRTVWIVDVGKEAPRLVTAYPGQE